MADILTDVLPAFFARAARFRFALAGPGRDRAAASRRKESFAGHAGRTALGQAQFQLVKCANAWTSSFVLFFPARPHVGAGRPVGSTPLRVRTVFFRAVMFPRLPTSSYYPACRSFSPQAAQSTRPTRGLGAAATRPS